MNGIPGSVHLWAQAEQVTIMGHLRRTGAEMGLSSATSLFEFFSLHL